MVGREEGKHTCRRLAWIWHFAFTTACNCALRDWSLIRFFDLSSFPIIKCHSFPHTWVLTSSRMPMYLTMLYESSLHLTLATCRKMPYKEVRKPVIGGWLPSKSTNKITVVQTRLPARWKAWKFHFWVSCTQLANFEVRPSYRKRDCWI